MLLKFIVGNYLTFDTIEEFTMLCGKSKNFTSDLVQKQSYSILKLSCIFQRNSILLQAFNFFKTFILEDKGKGKAYFITQPSIFEVKFTWKGNSYCYGITIKLKDNKVLKTWLKNINRPEENVNSTVIKEWLNTVKINPKVIKPYDIVVLTNTDNYLSPKQIKTLINYYRNQKTQLILESMYSPLLTLELFRKDEIWLETKDKIFSLDVVKEHFYKRIPLEYRGGIYYLMPF